MKKIYVYMCVCVYIYTQNNYFAVHQKLTQHCKSTILQFKKSKYRSLKGKEIHTICYQN